MTFNFGQFIFHFLLLSVFLTFCGFENVSIAQTVNPAIAEQEFVQSTSRLRDGRTVTRTIFSDPNKPAQVVISSPPRVANLQTFQNTPRVQSSGNFPRVAQGNGIANTAPSIGAPPSQLNPPPNYQLPPHLPNSNPQLPANNQIANGQQVYPYPVQQNPNPAWANRSYQPIVKLRTLPANTYLGQGMIGQPKAYVPGEPIRNAIRYIMP